MSSAVTIREGGSADREFVRDLGVRTMPDSVAPFRHVIPALLEASFDGLLQFVFGQPHLLLIAQAGDERAGYILTVDGMPDEVTRMPQAFIAYMAVEPSMRRRGIARQLLSAAEEAARKKGLPYMALMVTDDNAAAMDLYASAGFLNERRLLCKPL